MMGKLTHRQVEREGRSRPDRTGELEFVVGILGVRVGPPHCFALLFFFVCVVFCCFAFYIVVPLSWIWGGMGWQSGSCVGGEGSGRGAKREGRDRFAGNRNRKSKKKKRTPLSKKRPCEMKTAYDR